MHFFLKNSHDGNKLKKTEFLQALNFRQSEFNVVAKIFFVKKICDLDESFLELS